LAQRKNGWILRDKKYIAGLDSSGKIKREIYFVEDWNDKKKGKIINENFRNAIEDGGSVFGVFYENKLIAFSILLNEPPRPEG
jgi:hypothetical protein